ncbi:sensor histidine kinase [Muriicola jejuensis]|uniref:histidine kinase n=1 Tax=Muriicola jejuensis TaxID=504488 RepID=A0A6P0U934_9FLAO|nr:sensor histidine kinase [Muriicola jejuensis]NER09705.1 hypothetical protein [Muriicola jejuensis]
MKAQSEKLHFEQISKVDDISLGKINAIIQDSYGFIWFSDQTNRCILRYDGSQMKRFAFDPEKENALGGFYPECFAADSDGALWIGYSDKGVDHFDPDTESFTHYTHDPDDPESLSDGGVSAILVAHDGMVWIGTDKGLDKLDPSTGKFTHFRNDERDDSSLSHNVVRAIYEDSENTLWIGTGFPWNNAGEGGLNRYNPATNAFTRYMSNSEDPNSLKANQVRAICEDSRGNFWIGTNKNGLHKMDRKTGKITRYEFNPEFPAFSIPESTINMQHITFIHEDLEGYLWIGTYSDGIYRWNPLLNIMTHYGTQGLQSGNYKENSSWWCHVSDGGLIWISTQENKLFRIDPYIPQISNIQHGVQIRSLVVKDTSELWMGTYNKGLFRKNQITERIEKFTSNNKDPRSLSNDHITNLFVDRKSNLWVGTYNGLNLFNEPSNSFTRFMPDTNDSGSLVNAFISDIYEDSRSNLWIGTVNGVHKLDRKKGTFKKYTNQHMNYSDTAGWGVKIVEDLSGKVWVGSVEGGVYNVNEQTDQLDLVFTGPAIRDLYVDKKGILWAGANTGLWSSDKGWTKMSPFKIDETGIFLGEWTYTLSGDTADNLWIGTDVAIVKLGTDRKNKEIFGIRNGVVANGFPDLSYSYKDKEGRMYFASSPNGYYTFQPDEFKKSPGKMALYAMDLKVNNEPVYARENGILETSLYRAGKIRLNYNENNFSLSFAAVDLRAELKKRIFYMLQGYDSEWQESLSGQKVTYNKVPPGNYSLTYRSAIGNTGDWEEKSLGISITPPWWKTNWAYAFYTLLLALGIFFFDKYQKGRILAKEKALAREKELKHAREIEKAYTKLKATQAQLIQSEKMASLGELTAGIAHEIQNPLNFVNNFSEVSKELIAEMLEEIQKGDMEEAQTLAEDIVQNLEKIHHHGQRADGIVKGMLQHSRSGSGEKEPTDLNTLADEYLRLAYHGLRAKDKSFNATLETYFDPDVGKVNVMAQDMGRVILNLITNAFYAVKEKKEKEREGYTPTVTVTTRKKENGVEVSVKDNGEGIPEAIREKIFQPFFTTKPTGQGTGLGLSMSYDIVTKGHGGELKLKTKLGEGTTFTVQIPSS